MFRSKVLRERFIVFFLALSMVVGPGYNMYLHYDFSHTIDTRTYLDVAKGNFEGESLTRRYRVVVPAIAAVVAWPISKIYTAIWPHRPADEWPLRLAFYIVNSLLAALAGIVIFYTCKAYGATAVSSFVAMTAIMAGRWMNYTAGLPMTDSLYLLIVSLTLYAIKTKNNTALIACIFLGPLAKESFIFIAPIIFFFGSVAKWKQVVLFLLSGALVFSLRWWIDRGAGTGGGASLENALMHSENFIVSLKRIFSIKGLGELFTIMGTFTFMILAGFLGKRAETYSWRKAVDAPLLLMVLAIIIHAVLSGEVSRMLFLGSVIWAVLLALVLDRHKYFGAYRRLLNLDKHPMQ